MDAKGKAALLNQAADVALKDIQKRSFNKGTAAGRRQFQWLKYTGWREAQIMPFSIPLQLFGFTFYSFDSPKMAFRSSSTVPVGAMLNCSTR